MAKPSIRDLLSHLNTDFDGGEATCVLCGELAYRVERVLALHRCPTESGAKYADACPACGELWPCPTVRALEGEE